MFKLFLVLLHNLCASIKCAFTCSSLSWLCLFLTCCSRLLLSFCAALILCLLLVSALHSYSQWDSTDLPLCEAYRRRDSWASANSSNSSTHGEREDVDGPPSQETNPQHHLNGHGTASVEKPWGGKGDTCRFAFAQFGSVIACEPLFDLLLFCIEDFKTGLKLCNEWFLLD